MNWLKKLFGTKQVKKESPNESKNKSINKKEEPIVKKVQAIYTKAVNQKKSGKWHEAIKSYHSILDIDPNHKYALNDLGEAYHLIGPKEKAIELFEKAIKLDPKFYNAWFNKGKWLDDLNKFEESLMCFDRCIELEPNNSLSYSYKSSVLLSQEDFEEALKYANEAIRINPDDELAFFAQIEIEEKIENKKKNINKRQVSTPENKEPVVENIENDLHDTQLNLEQFAPSNFPIIVDEMVSFMGQEYSLHEWFKMYKDEELFIWSLPEKDYGEPRHPFDWKIYKRNTEEKQKMENEYIDIYIKYAKIIMSYSKKKLLPFTNQSQYVTANTSVVWINMAPKYKMLRREFVSLEKAMKMRLDKELRKVFS